MALRRQQANTDDILQLAQLSMVFQRLNEEIGIDREALQYNRLALNARFNELLRSNVPPLEKRAKTFQEMTIEDLKPAIRGDPLLQLFKKQDYIYHITRANIEEKEHSIADLLFDYPQNVENRYTLVCTLPELRAQNSENWGIIDSNPVTKVNIGSNIPGLNGQLNHGVYRIYCFQCSEFFLFEMTEGDTPNQIACDKCHEVIIEKRGRHLQ